MKRQLDVSITSKRCPKVNFYLLKGIILSKHRVFLFKAYEALSLSLSLFNLYLRIVFKALAIITFQDSLL